MTYMRRGGEPETRVSEPESQTNDANQSGREICQQEKKMLLLSVVAR